MIGACIITYNPEIERLSLNLESISCQVDLVVIVDNGSKNIVEIEQCLSKFGNYKLILNECNCGIATALNQGMKFLDSIKFKWAVTLDQDSISPNNLIKEFKEYLNDSKIGIIAPSIVDRNAEERDLKRMKSNEKISEVNWCITSGACTNLKALHEVGWFDEKLFIDFVDYDICVQLKKSNYKIIKLQTIYLYHEVGKMSPKKILFKEISVWNHSPIRKYYYFRNPIYLCKKYNDNTIRLECFKSWLFMLGKVLLYEGEKVEKLKMMWKGTCDGIKGKMGKLKTEKK